MRRIKEEPLWYDNHGVPRYEPYHPMKGGVYARISVLYTIECQDCAKKFDVCSEWNYFWYGPEFKEPDLDLFITQLHYGDPPNHGCIGDTMNCVDLYVKEAWENFEIKEGPNMWRWRRHPELDGLVLTTI